MAHPTAMHPRDPSDEVETRRVRPRQEREFATAASSAMPPPVLYADALASVFRFLDVSGLTAALHVSRLWHIVVRQRMPSTDLSVHFGTMEQLRQRVSPLVAHHVGRLTEISGSLTQGEVRALAGPPWTGLHVLDCAVGIDRAQPQNWLFPPRLHTLRLRDFSESRPEEVDLVLEAVAQLTQLESLSLTLNVRESLLSCLLRLSCLRSLSLPCANLQFAEELKPRFLDYCRELSQLRILSVNWLKPTDVVYLLRPGHRLQQLQQLERFTGLDDAATALLPSLPALRTLRVGVLQQSSFAFIGQMHQLRELNPAMYRMLPGARAALLSSGTAGHFARIISMTLSAGDLQSDEMAVLLAGMPQLSRLTLQGCRELRSLRFLATAQLAASLTALHLNSCDALPLEELEHLHGLKRLRSLVVRQSFVAPLPSEMRLFTPGSALLLLPRLFDFEYRPPRASVAAGAQ